MSQGSPAEITPLGKAMRRAMNNAAMEQHATRPMLYLLNVKLPETFARRP
jgi:hypothetical protein